MKTSPNHTHGASAADRSTGSLFIDTYCKGLGVRAWYYQKSKADERNHRVGSRVYYWAKDLTTQPCLFNPLPDDVLALVDVDHYVDMPNFLCDNFKPMLLYTFQPSAVSKSDGEYKYTFNGNNEALYSVSGGATYVHEVWNYNMDTLYVSKKIFGMIYNVCIYNVDRRYVDADHALVLMSPVKRWRGIAAMFASELMGTNLERLHVVNGSYTRMLVNRKDCLYVSTGKINRYLSITVPIDTDEYIESVALTSKVGLMFAQVKSKVGEDHSGTAILYEYHISKVGGIPAMVFPLDKYVHGYQFEPRTYDPEAKRAIVSFMKPIIDGAFAPDLTESNERQAIKGRIINVRTNTEKLLVDAFFLRCVDEFTTLLLGDFEGKLHPVDYEVVYNKQNRPSQRAILHQSEYMNAIRRNKGFLKREAYQSITDPRIISTVNGVDKMNWSMFIYSFSELLKTMDWCAFGKTPLEIATRVAEVSRHAKSMNNTDFSRWDGHVSQGFRYLERQVMMRAFRPEYREQLWEIQQTQYGLPCVMSKGTKFDGEWERLSGSAETSDFNTLDDAFTAFLAWRMTRNRSGQWTTPVEAFDSLGIYGGDDGLTPDVDPWVYAKAAKRMGQKLTIDCTNRGEVGVTFLSRYYSPDVWYGSLDSICDIKRTLTKFHTTVRMPNNILPSEKLLDKAFAYALTDLNTPIIGCLVREAVKYLPANYTFQNLAGNWNARFTDVLVQYPNNYGHWMLEFVKDALPHFDIGTFVSWTTIVRSLDELMEPPFCMLPVKPVTKTAVAVVDGDILEPGVKTPLSKRPQVVRKRPRKLSEPMKPVLRNTASSRPKSQR
jgi:hypothetical protein